MSPIRRTSIAIVVALAMIAGWFLRLAADLLPGWEGLAVPASGLAFSIFIEVIDRSINRAIKGASASEPDRG